MVKPAAHIFASRHIYTLIFGVVSTAMIFFTISKHDYVPMWIEGFGEFQGIFMTIFGKIGPPQRCWVTIGSVPLPLAVYEYVGASYAYVYVPFVYLWYNGFTNDPYIYRISGVLLFIAAIWLFYFLLRRFFSPVLALIGGALFVTAPPIAIFTITEYQSLYVVLPLVFGCLLLLKVYVDEGWGISLIAASALAGMMLLTRLETLPWFVLPLAVYLVVARPSFIRERWRNQNNKVGLLTGCIGGFILGSAPYLLYISSCSEANPFLFFLNRVYAPSITASSIPILAKISIRSGHFWSFLVLNRWNMFSLVIPNYVFAFAWISSLLVLTLNMYKRRTIALPLLYIVFITAISLLVTGSLREEHLSPLFPAMIATVVLGLAAAQRLFRLHDGVLLVIGTILIGANIATLALDWRYWENLPPTEQTMLNTSDPVALNTSLREHHPNDYILYTNIGMAPFQSYMNRGNVRGDDIIDWTNTDRFLQAAKLALLKTDLRRVFVVVPLERDGAVGTFRRTASLYNLLAENQIPYTTERIATPRNPLLYDLVVVEPGVGPKPKLTTDPWRFESLGFNPDLTTPTTFTGWLIGSGFEPDDVIIVNGVTQLATTYSSPTVLTYIIPRGAIDGTGSFTLEVVRAKTLQRSRRYLVATRPGMTIRLDPAA